MKFNTRIILKSAEKYKQIGYLCESLEHLPIAYGLISNLPTVRIFSTSPYIVNYLQSIGIEVTQLNLIDLNPHIKPWDFLKAYLRLMSQIHEFL
jgi:hypothetical protein